METLTLDYATLRIQLDTLIKDHEEFLAAGTAKQKQLEQLQFEIQQYNGALQYNRVLREKLEKQLAALKPQ